MPLLRLQEVALTVDLIVTGQGCNQMKPYATSKEPLLKLNVTKRDHCKYLF